MESIISLFIAMTMMTVPIAKPSNPEAEPTVTMAVQIAEPSSEIITPTASPLEFPIEYDDAEERKAHYARDFRLISAEKTDSGYKIIYSIKTFLEGRGPVGVNFNCFDADGKIVDSFGGMFIGTDYTWSEHEAEAVISDKTVKIALRLEE